MDLQNKHIVVAGLGKTGVSVSEFLVNRGAQVTVTDTSMEESLHEAVSKVRAIGVRVELGVHDDKTFTSADMIVLSPGVPHTIPQVLAAMGKNIPVIGEIELAYCFINTPIIAVTGTNGKSTTTMLIGEILKESGHSVFLGGNLGTPLIDYAAAKEPADFVVAEISSFQLDTIETFKPKVSVLLNITDDHLDRYPDFTAYAQSKARMFVNQSQEDVAVYNGADPAIGTVTENIRSKRYVYNSDSSGHAACAWISDHAIHFSLKEKGDFAIACDDILLQGRFNLENASAAGLASMSVGASIEAVEKALQGFKGLPHRIQYIDTIGGVKYYDDSKGTNVDAVARALESFSSPVVLIMGGRDKGGEYSALNPQLDRIVKHVIVMGEAGEKIVNTLGSRVPVTQVMDMTHAVKAAAEISVSGDVVLLSPACSSFDMYKNYAQRGDDFQHQVFSIKKAIE